jgi:hypothetical protein
MVFRFFHLPNDTQLPSRSFRAVSESYMCGSFRSVLDLGTMDPQDKNSTRFYDYEDIKAALWSDTNAEIFEEFESITCENDQYWKLCSVAVPWFDKLGIDPEYGVFCEVCNDGSDESRALFIPHSLRELRELPQGLERCDLTWDMFWPNHMTLPLMRVKELEEHMWEVHPGDAIKDA